jgi:hypothetical protein
LPQWNIYTVAVEFTKRTTAHRRSIRQPSPERDPHRLKRIFVSAAEKVAGKVDGVNARVTPSGNARYSDERVISNQ